MWPDWDAPAHGVHAERDFGGRSWAKRGGPQLTAGSLFGALLRKKWIVDVKHEEEELVALV